MSIFVRLEKKAKEGKREYQRRQIPLSEMPMPKTVVKSCQLRAMFRISNFFSLAVFHAFFSFFFSFFLSTKQGTIVRKSAWHAL